MTVFLSTQDATLSETFLSAPMTPPLSNQAPAAIASVNLAAILYDLDGTLVNTDPLHFQVWQAMLREFELEIDEPCYQTKISGRLNPAIVQDLLPHLSPPQQQQFIEQKEARFREQAPQLTPLAGLMEVIQWAKKRAATALMAVSIVLLAKFAGVWEALIRLPVALLLTSSLG